MSTSAPTLDAASKDKFLFKEQELLDFFPATRSEFVPKCGTINSVKQTDFEDEHRRRHLASFRNSWNEWLNFDTERNAADPEKAAEFVTKLLKLANGTRTDWTEMIRKIRKELRINVSKTEMISAYEKVHEEVGADSSFEQFLVKKSVRSHSGVLVITVLTSPGAFSCPKDCHYCPNEPGQPRSYLSTEPAVLRANQNGWDAALQFWDRAWTLYSNGHIIDKIEVLVLGGTWSGYPHSYQEEFVRDLFYAANTFNDFVLKRESEAKSEKTFPLVNNLEGMRARYTLEEEQLLNEDCSSRVIGLTLETRPDHISQGELKRLRSFGCTRVQIGVQHVDDDILIKINRGHSLKDAIRGIRLLKDSCFKVDIHLMPDLPGSSPHLDKAMFEYVLSSPDLQVDQWKIYPCEVTPFSVIENWYRDGLFVPYAERNDGRELTELLVKVKTAVHPWIRLNRVVRDIPNPSIIAGNAKTNLRQILLDCMEKRGLVCRCLRCREVKTTKIKKAEATLVIRKYETQGGIEFFLSYESADEAKLFGFLRLRIRDEGQNVEPSVDLRSTFPELIGCGLIRELHVYGQLVGSTETKKEGDHRSQHEGFGTRLLVASEVIACAYGLEKMAVIAGVGTRNYYRKFGYETERYFMTKSLSKSHVEERVRNVHLDLPLTVQVYKVKTDLGVLGMVQEKPPVEEVILQHRLKSKKKRKPAEDILTCFGTNIAASEISKTHAYESVTIYPKFKISPILYVTALSFLGTLSLFFLLRSRKS